MRRFFCVLHYDAGDDRRRPRVVRIVEGNGLRVQRSVFQRYLGPARVGMLGQRLAQTIVSQEDGGRLYRLCEICRRQLEMLARGKTPSPPSAFMYAGCDRARGGLTDWGRRVTTAASAGGGPISNPTPAAAEVTIV
jgi:CRISPR-associated protein Cas2